MKLFLLLNGQERIIWLFKGEYFRNHEQFFLPSIDAHLTSQRNRIEYIIIVIKIFFVTASNDWKDKDR